MGFSFSLRRTAAAGALLIATTNVHADLKAMADQEMRAITGGSALQYSATDISYELSQLIGVQYDADGNRAEKRTATEQVDATVHRIQINGDGELHAYAEKFTLGDYAGGNNSIYKQRDNEGNLILDSQGNPQGVPENALRDFGFGNSASEPFYFEDPYIEIQRQHRADGSTSIRGIRIGFGKAEGHTPVTIDSSSGYIQTLSLIPELGGLISGQIYGTGTKDMFVHVIGDTLEDLAPVSPDDIPDGTGNYPQYESGSLSTAQHNNVSGPLDTSLGGLESVSDLRGINMSPLNLDLSAQAPGGKELNLEHVVSLDFHNVQNFYISLTQGGGASFQNDDESINGALWSQHLEGVIPKSRADLPGWNMVMPFNDMSNPTAGYVEAHTNTEAALSQILLGTGDNNPRQSYQPLF